MATPAGLAGSLQDQGDFCLEIWQIVLDNVPDLFNVNAQVIMDHHVPEFGDIPSFDVRVRGLQVFGESLSGFSQCVQVS